MVITLLLVVPVVAAAASFAVRQRLFSQSLLVGVALAHLVLTGAAWVHPAAPVLWGWFGLDALGLWFLSGLSVLLLPTSVYTVGYLRRRVKGPEDHSDSWFVGTLLLFVATMTAVPLALHFELLWVALEATTLASAPLIYFHRSRHAVEATWKYLMVCSVGIALALLGTVFLVGAAARAEVFPTVSGMVAGAGALDQNWVRLAFVFFVVGYGTKMGLAPMHAWLPDAHSEAPSPVSALLSGASLNCALLAILRCLQVVEATGDGAFARSVLLGLGLVSMAFAVVFILNQKDFKRLLAYSSVEHMGIIAVGVGLGGMAAWGALLHALIHGWAKGAFFMLSGNVLSTYGTKEVGKISGIARLLPATGLLWIIAIVVITAIPPSGLFVSELLILRGALGEGRPAVTVTFLLLLFLAFVGLTRVLLPMLLGAKGAPVAREHDDGRDRGESVWLVLPPAVLMAAAVLLGVALPEPLRGVLESAMLLLGGGQ